MSEATIKNHAAFIWSVADLLRGDYKQSEYGKVILPLVVLRRLDCVLEPTKAKVLAAHDTHGDREAILRAAAGGQPFFNTSKLDVRRLLDDPGNVAGNLRGYVAGFSTAARDVLDKFEFDVQITRLDKANLLYLVVSNFAEIDLHPEVVSNLEMGYLYEELIRRFSEFSNETAGEHFTPREVIQLMVRLLFIEDDDLLAKPGVVKTLFDPACGTGGMLSVGEDYLRSTHPAARLEVYGQELNAETYAICRSDMMLKGQTASHIAHGNSFSEDGHQGGRFDYLLANPPFGVEWKQVDDAVRTEHAKAGFAGRFGAGLPRINDGSFLFLQHMISKMRPVAQGGSRLAIVFNGSPLFTGAAGSGESEIRRWIIENDWLEAVVALPDQLLRLHRTTAPAVARCSTEPDRDRQRLATSASRAPAEPSNTTGDRRLPRCRDQRYRRSRYAAEATAQCPRCAPPRFVGEEDFRDLTDGRRPRRGDLIYSRNASIGTAAYVASDEPFAMGQDVCLITSIGQDQRYLGHVLNTLGVDQLEQLKIGSTFSRVNVAQIQELLIPDREPSEQRAMADDLDQRSASYTRVVAQLDRALELLAERKQALITAAVTGQHDLARQIAEEEAS